MAKMTAERVKDAAWWRVLQILSVLWFVLAAFGCGVYWWEEKRDLERNLLKKEEIEQSLVASDLDESLALNAVKSGVDRDTAAYSFISELIDRGVELKKDDEVGTEDDEMMPILANFLDKYDWYREQFFELNLIEGNIEYNHEYMRNCPIVFGGCVLFWFLSRLCLIYILTGKLSLNVSQK